MDFNTPDICLRDLAHIWHPCSQMKDYEHFKPLPVKRARGVYLELTDGTKLIDAISSWWCKAVGHNHPKLKRALKTQLEKFEHIILANTCNETLVQMCEQLATLSPSLNKMLFASDGACAIEMAIKLSIQAQQLQRNTKRQKLMALSNGYHGETALTMSVSDVGAFKQPYRNLLLPCHFLNCIPYVCSKNDPLWQDCSSVWPHIENQLEQQKQEMAAILVEPILQGTGGMLIYSQDFLRRLRSWTESNDIHLIADEILTGLGRTGLPLACHHADIEPDFLCLGKSLTGGFLPMSVTLTKQKIYDLFYAKYEEGKNFLHSHTHSGNALAAAVALEYLKLLKDEDLCQQSRKLEPILFELMQDVADTTGMLQNIRGIGAVVAADIKIENIHPRHGYRVYQKAVELGALLRPIGNTLYWLPPFNINEKTLYKLRDITAQALRETQ